MKHLNTNQQILVLMIFAIFIVSNILTILVVLPKIKDKGILKFLEKNNLTLSVYNSNGHLENEEHLKYNQLNLVNKENIYIVEEEKFEMYAKSLVEFTYSKELLDLKITRGNAYIKSLDSFQLIFGNAHLSIPKGFTGIFNADNVSLIIIEGEIKINNEKLSSNYLVYNFRNKFESEKIDRTIFTQDKGIADLLDFVKSKTIISKNLEDLIPPNIIVTSPKDNWIINSDVLIIKGQTEANANLKINGIEVEIDSNGNFEYKTKLKKGLNNFSLESSDQFENKNFLDVGFTYTPKEDKTTSEKANNSDSLTQ